MSTEPPWRLPAPGAPTPHPPYGPDIKARNWKFELELERITASDTWALAQDVPLAQPLLLMTWTASWLERPCGSLPANEDAIRAKVRVPPAMWPEVRLILLRGWWLASDGRLYHDVLIERVTEMLGRRRSDADRQAAKRMRDAKAAGTATTESPATPGSLTGESRVTPGEVARESSTENREQSTQSATALSARGAIGLALKAAGMDMSTVNLSDPRVDPLIAAGATAEQFAGLAREAIHAGKSRPWPWILTVLPDRLSAGKNFIKPSGRHTGFTEKDYRHGVASDGSIA